MRKSLITGRRLGFLEFECVVEADLATCLKKLAIKQIPAADTYLFGKPPRRLEFRMIDKEKHLFKVTLMQYSAHYIHRFEGRLQEFSTGRTLIYGRFFPDIGFQIGVYCFLPLFVLGVAMGNFKALPAVIFFAVIWIASLFRNVNISITGLTESLKAYLERG